MLGTFSKNDLYAYYKSKTGLDFSGTIEPFIYNGADLTSNLFGSIDPEHFKTIWIGLFSISYAISGAGSVKNLKLDYNDSLNNNPNQLDFNDLPVTSTETLMISASNFIGVNLIQGSAANCLVSFVGYKMSQV